MADDVLRQGVQGITDLITVPGLINLDFADVRTVMNEAGVALMGTGVGRGNTRAIDAATAAISSPLLEDLSIEGARGVLINITGGSDMTLYEVNEASSLIHEAAHEDANIIVGAVIDETLHEDELRVTVIATGLDGQEMRRMPPPSRRRTPEPTYEIQRERAMVDAPNVTPLREALAAAPFAAATAAAGGASADSASAEELDFDIAQTYQQVANGSPTATDLAATGLGGFASPFDDEFETPAFLRKGVGSFMRRGGD
jgi:cell division protein FtsZ